MVLKTCRWCKKEFETDIPNKLYCSDTHRNESRLEKVRNARLKHYYKNKVRVNVEELGTISIGSHMKILEPLTHLGIELYPNSKFREEKITIQKLYNTTNIETNITGKVKTKKKFGKNRNNVWIDYEVKMEYGHVQPLVIQQTHKNASFDDYVNTSIQYVMQNRPPCEECECTVHIKDMKHCIISCSNCGLVLEGGPGLMSWTAQDTMYVKGTKDLQAVAWSKYHEQVDFLNNKFRRTDFP